MTAIHHALVLNLHQPAGNLEYLLEHRSWEAKEILFAFDRIPRALWQFSDLARVHLSLSGTLLETLANSDFQQRVYGTVDCGSLLWHLQNQQIFEILGTAYYHPVLPLIPPLDRAEQIRRWRGIGGHIFCRDHFNGFWPPELGFSMELIPMLKQAGYTYVLVDSENVKALEPMSWHELRYRPHLARYGDDEIVVVVRDRDLSNAQESGMDYGWFQHEVRERTKYCDFPPLVTTCSDGENGGWFRNVTEDANFWGAFYATLLANVQSGPRNILPIFISEYLERYGAHGYVEVERAAWNTGWHDGKDFTQWTGSLAQKEALSRLAVTSAAIHEAADHPTVRAGGNDVLLDELENSLWRLLRAETSCNFYWGEAWVDKCQEDLNKAWLHLDKVRQYISSR